MAATHNGMCQVCGAEQALPNGRLSLHGYTVPHGFFQGVCPGAKELPLEQDRTVSDRVAASLRKQSIAAAQRAVDLRAGTLLPTRAKNGERERDPNNSYRWHDVYVPYADAPSYYQEEAVERCVNNAEDEARQAARIAGMMDARADLVTGKKELTPRATEQKRELAVGDRVKMYGSTGTVEDIRGQVANGCGPHLNGHYMNHAIIRWESGRKGAIPVRLIRKSAIL